LNFDCIYSHGSIKIVRATSDKSFLRMKRLADRKKY